ncbi:hypothetical protein SOVF_110980 [Spinacia oleracea]|nr:hypothetical protein SOVF_110980 [Spinacia oleracea]
MPNLDTPVEPQRYYKLLEKDTIQFVIALENICCCMRTPIPNQPQLPDS